MEQQYNIFDSKYDYLISNTYSPSSSKLNADIIKKCPKISPDKADEFLIRYEEIVKNSKIQKLNFDKFDKQITDQEVGDLLDFYNKKKKYSAIIHCAHGSLNKHGITKDTIKTVCK